MLRRFRSLLESQKNREGIALVTSLLIIALLMAVVVEFNRIAIADVEVSKNIGDEKKLLYLTISGMNAVKELLRLDGIYTMNDTLMEEWARGQAHFDAATAMLDEGKIQGEIIDECGKIPVNSLVGPKGDFDELHKGLWERLLRQPRFALSPDQINTIIYSVKDWIDRDDDITGIHGAEDIYYMSLGYHCKNFPLAKLEEMLMIKGITEDIFYGNEYRSGIGPYFTVYGGNAININTAPIPVLMALAENMTEDMAKEMDEFRRNDINKMFLNHKNWYKRVWPFQTPLPEDLLTTTSTHFLIRIQSALRDSRKDILSVIFRTKESAEIIYWQEL